MNRENDGNGGNPQVCAACKHQRRRCDDTCEFAPYFPGNRYLEFHNAQRLFGVSNIQKLMSSIEPHQRKAAAESILAEGNARFSDPVHGSLGIVQNLKMKIEFYEKQLGVLNQQLELYRSRRDDQKEKQEKDDHQVSQLPPPLPSSELQNDLPNTNNMEIFEHGYNHPSTSAESVDLYQNGNALPDRSGEPSGSSMAPVKDEENVAIPVSSSSKGKECVVDGED